MAEDPFRTVRAWMCVGCGERFHTLAKLDAHQLKCKKMKKKGE